jgi:hypothetical protein
MFRSWVSTRAGRLRMVSSEAKVLRRYIVGAELYICPGVTSHAISGATHRSALTLDNAGLFLLERLKIAPTAPLLNIHALARDYPLRVFPRFGRGGL